MKLSVFTQMTFLGADYEFNNAVMMFNFLYASASRLCLGSNTYAVAVPKSLEADSGEKGTEIHQRFST